MKVQTYIQRITNLDRMIRQGRTGNYQELAYRLGISPRHLRNTIEEINDAYGAGIRYDRGTRSFKYTKPVTLKAVISYERQETSNPG